MPGSSGARAWGVTGVPQAPGPARDAPVPACPGPAPDAILPLVDDLSRAGLLLFAILSSLGVVPVLLRSLRPAVLLAVHGVGMCVAFGAAVSALTGAQTGPALAVPYAAMVGLVGLEHHALKGPRAGWRLASVFLSVAGLLLALIAQLWTDTGPLVSVVAALLTVAYAVPIAFFLLRRARTSGVPVRAAGDRAASGAVLLAALGLSLGTIERQAPGLWPVVLGAAGALCSAIRTRPYTPPTGREWLAITLLSLAGLLAFSVVAGPRGGFLLGGYVFAFAAGVTALSRPLVETRKALPWRSSASSSAPPAREDPLARGTLGVLAPMLDDGTLRRPSPPTVVSRVPARRILDAALEQARSRQVGLDRQELRVEIRSDEGDVDVECDVGDVAEALCAVLDNALTLRNEHPSLYIKIHLRGGHRHVTFEVSDDLAEHLAQEAQESGAEAPPTAPVPDAEHPFFSARPRGARPGLGLGLARARILVERQGGMLLTRRTEEGSCVQLTVPRRRERPSSALA